MEIQEKHIFNLWDTNGRRSDILNALNVYLNILKEMKDDGTFDKWSSYPSSITQFHFYKKAIEQSPEVFQDHPKFDNFIESTGLKNELGINKYKFAKLVKNDSVLLKVLDEAIEQRARHYTSNLVRFGFATSEREITPAGYSYISGKIEKDVLENLLPLNDTNIILLRQLMKLRIFSSNFDGKRYYYSPFFMALNLLLNQTTVDRDDFTYIVQGLNPYYDQKLLNELIENKDYTKLANLICEKEFAVPISFMLPGLVEEGNFNTLIKNRKSNKTVDCYYDFYVALSNFVDDMCDANYAILKNVYLANKEKLKKAFCLGKTLFDFGTNGVYDLNTFISKNAENPFITAKNLNYVFYLYYERSKYLDQICEYSDTTLRVLGATGLFKFKTMPELSDKTLLSILFNCDTSSKIFGQCSNEEYEKYENLDFGSNATLIDILGYDQNSIDKVLVELSNQYGTNDETKIKKSIETKTNNDFVNFIETAYPKDKIIELLGLFSDRTNDEKIKKEISESATVPTIYEYIVGIAWYYISNKNFDLYKSFNLTLNADFGPEMHAGGGEGDIVIDYDKESIMLEVTLMNKTAQKRGEWEPVLRHSLNNKAAKEGKESLTFFIADELDFNTINIWRAVAAAPLKSTQGDEKEVNGVIIMPFTNSHLVSFLEKNIESNVIIKEVRESFAKVPKITESNWHSEIIAKL